MSKPDGGSVYPHGDFENHNPHYGISMRDFFAAAALQALCAEYFRANGACVGMDHPFHNIPAHAYRMADAMLNEREK